ncbi:MAG: flagellar hook-length control protein FliK [Nannocystaceae bacterium]
MNPLTIFNPNVASADILTAPSEVPLADSEAFSDLYASKIRDRKRTQDSRKKEERQDDARDAAFAFDHAARPRAESRAKERSDAKAADYERSPSPEPRPRAHATSRDAKASDANRARRDATHRARAEHREAETQPRGESSPTQEDPTADRADQLRTGGRTGGQTGKQTGEQAGKTTGERIPSQAPNPPAAPPGGNAGLQSVAAQLGGAPAATAVATTIALAGDSTVNPHLKSVGAATGGQTFVPTHAAAMAIHAVPTVSGSGAATAPAPAPIFAPNVAPNVDPASLGAVVAGQLAQLSEVEPELPREPRTALMRDTSPTPNQRGVLSPGTPSHAALQDPDHPSAQHARTQLLAPGIPPIATPPPDTTGPDSSSAQAPQATLSGAAAQTSAVPQDPDQGTIDDGLNVKTEKASKPTPVDARTGSGAGRGASGDGSDRSGSQLGRAQTRVTTATPSKSQTLDAPRPDTRALRESIESHLARLRPIPAGGARVRLHVPQLGDVQLHIRANEEGNYSLDIATSDRHAAQALARDQAVLQDALRLDGRMVEVAIRSEEDDSQTRDTQRDLAEAFAEGRDAHRHGSTAARDKHAAASENASASAPSREVHQDRRAKDSLIDSIA